MLLNNQQITEEIKKEIKICIEMNENENTTTQNSRGQGHEPRGISPAFQLVRVKCSARPVAQRAHRGLRTRNLIPS